MNKSSLYVSILALVVSVAAMVICSKNCNKAASVAPVNAENVSAVLNENPQLIIDALQKYEQVQREAQAQQAAKLFMDNLEQINNAPNVPYVGDKNAEIVLVEFFDFSCGYCKRLAPALETIVETNPDIKVVFQPITFVSPVSGYAAQAALAAAEQGKFMPVYKAMLGYEGRLTEETINNIAEKSGLDMARFAKDVKSEKTMNTIKEVATLAEKVQIHGVPSLILNGKQLQTIDAEGIQAEINKLK